MNCKNMQNRALIKGSLNSLISSSNGNRNNHYQETYFMAVYAQSSALNVRLKQFIEPIQVSGPSHSECTIQPTFHVSKSLSCSDGIKLLLVQNKPILFSFLKNEQLLKSQPLLRNQTPYQVKHRVNLFSIFIVIASYFIRSNQILQQAIIQTLPQSLQ